MAIRLENFDPRSTNLPIRRSDCRLETDTLIGMCWPESEYGEISGSQDPQDVISWTNNSASAPNSEWLNSSGSECANFLRSPSENLYQRQYNPEETLNNSDELFHIPVYHSHTKQPLVSQPYFLFEEGFRSNLLETFHRQNIECLNSSSSASEGVSFFSDDLVNIGAWTDSPMLDRTSEDCHSSVDEKQWCSSDSMVVLPQTEIFSSSDINPSDHPWLNIRMPTAEPNPSSPRLTSHISHQKQGFESNNPLNWYPSDQRARYCGDISEATYAAEMMNSQTGLEDCKKLNEISNAYEDLSRDIEKWNRPNMSTNTLTKPTKGGKPKQCPYLECKSKGFSTMYELSRHQKTVHEKGSKKYRCCAIKCRTRDKIWTRLDNFRSHLKTKHRKEDWDFLLQQCEINKENIHDPIFYDNGHVMEIHPTLQ